MLLTARIFKGDEAESMGLVNRSLPSEELTSYVNNYAENMALKTSPRSLAIMKRQIRAGYNKTFIKSLEEANAQMFASFEEFDFKEGVNSFMEKRPPKFRGIGS